MGIHKPHREQFHICTCVEQVGGGGGGVEQLSWLKMLKLI